MFAVCSGRRHVFILLDSSHICPTPRGDATSIFQDSFLYKHSRKDSVEQRVVNTLLKRCAEMLEINRELSPKFYKHLNFCTL